MDEDAEDGEHFGWSAGWLARRLIASSQMYVLKSPCHCECLHDVQDDDLYEDYDSDYEQRAQNAGAHTGVDPYAGIFFSKDRKEEVIEVEEEPEIIFSDGQQVSLMTQGEWMKGCPEGGEQGFLFQLYQSLSFGSCPCPYQCGATVDREKSHFFAVQVRRTIRPRNARVLTLIQSSLRQSSAPIPRN